MVGPGCRDRWKLVRAVAIILFIGCAGISPGSAQDVELRFPANVMPGENVKVSWRGPDAPGDFIAIAQPGAPAASFTAYARTSVGSPAILTAPDSGEYEVRYVNAGRLAVLAAAPLSVAAAQAAGLAAPSEVVAGKIVTVTIGAPGDPADYVTIVPPDTDALALGPYARLRGANQVSIAAPAVPGPYEVRQMRAADQTTLARAPISVVPAAPSSNSADTEAPDADVGHSHVSADSLAPEVTLMALVAVDAGARFHVAWTGPGAAGDRIAVVPPGAVVEAAVGTAAPQDGSPAGLMAPEVPGDYDIVYLDGTTGHVRARRGLEVR